MENKKYCVSVGFIDFGEITAKDEQEARDIVCRMAGYQNEKDMENRLQQSSRLKVVEL